MSKELLKAGIYAIINKRLRMVYIGVTQDCFLIRWIEHLKRMPIYIYNNDRIRLYLAEDTKYIVLKEIDPATNDKKKFYELENEAQNFYKESDWIVLSTSTYKKDTVYASWDATVEAKKKRYRHAISHMVSTISLEDKAASKLYAALYKKVDKEFDANVCPSSKQGNIEDLTTAQLRFIMLNLYPRYKLKSIDKMRKQYIQADIQLDLFT